MQLLDDIHNQVDAHTIRLRLLLSRRSFREALLLADRTWPRLPGVPQHYEFLATRALAYAIVAPPEDARDALAGLGPQRTGEVRTLARLATAILALRVGSVNDELTRLV